ncbi:TspO/MBR family protein [Microthyrium microscopicum]|uniref:TspO/MBR family protein n=1 Tax=Microthyrium microscopicum TaxID=703497 RepID=A0A6A6UWU9_9PEZI|nr:TspO/MBR family protein [Microthyrium microscopicum]
MTSFLQSLALPAYVFSKPAAAILLPLSLGNGIGIATRPDKSKQRYRQLKQPPLNPPAWLFGPVWTCLYAAMGYASWRAWNTGINSFSLETVELTKTGAALYTIQLGLNLAWMPLFFGMERPIAATVDIIALLGTNAYLTYVWSKVDTVAAWTMVPYLGWTCFATYLCAGCGYLNNGDFSKVPRKGAKAN